VQEHWPVAALHVPRPLHELAASHSSPRKHALSQTQAPLDGSQLPWPEHVCVCSHWSPIMHGESQTQLPLEGSQLPLPEQVSCTEHEPSASFDQHGRHAQPATRSHAPLAPGPQFTGTVQAPAPSSEKQLEHWHVPALQPVAPGPQSRFAVHAPSGSLSLATKHASVQEQSGLPAASLPHTPPVPHAGALVHRPVAGSGSAHGSHWHWPGLSPRRPVALQGLTAKLPVVDDFSSHTGRPPLSS